jgi:hypothetical protein
VNVTQQQWEALMGDPEELEFFDPPPVEKPFEDASEARHAAAVVSPLPLTFSSLHFPFNYLAHHLLPVLHHLIKVALHALCGNLNLERVLPPQFRDLWRDLDVEAEGKKKDMIQNIIARAEREEAKKKEVEERPLRHRHIQQSVFMSEAARRAVESLVASGMLRRLEAELQVSPSEGSIFSPPSSFSLPLSSTSEEGKMMISSIVSMGFGEEDARMALDQTRWKDTSSALEWLLLHLKEESMPKNFDVRFSAVEVVTQKPKFLSSSTSTSTSSNLLQEVIETDPEVKFLQEALGLEREEREQILQNLDKNQRQKEKSLEDLFYMFFVPPSYLPSEGEREEEEFKLLLEEEEMTLDSIFGEKFSKKEENGYLKFSLRVSNDEEGGEGTSHLLEIYISTSQDSKGSRYPLTLPSALSLTSPSLNQSTRRRLLELMVKEVVGSLLGSPIIYSLSSFLQTKLDEVKKEVEAASKKVVHPHTEKKTTYVPSPSPSSLSTPSAFIPPSNSAPAQSELKQQKKQYSGGSRLPSADEITKASFLLLRNHEEKQKMAEYKQMQESRAKLPAADKRKDVLELIRKNSVIVLRYAFHSCLFLIFLVLVLVLVLALRVHVRLPPSFLLNFLVVKQVVVNQHKFLNSF